MYFQDIKSTGDIYDICHHSNEKKNMLKTNAANHFLFKSSATDQLRNSLLFSVDYDFDTALH